MENFNFNSVVEEVTNNYGVYKIICLENGKEYIGSGKLKGRFALHLNTLRANANRNSNLQEDWNKYGEDSFVIKIIAYTGNNDPRPLEDELIKKNFDSGNLYNIYNSAYGPTSIPEDVREKMSLSRIGFKQAKSTKEKIRKSMMGKRNGAKVTIEDAIKMIKHAKKNYMLYEFTSHLIEDMVPIFNVSGSTIKVILGGRHSLSPQLNEMGVKF